MRSSARFIVDGVGGRWLLLCTCKTELGETDPGHTQH